MTIKGTLSRTASIGGRVTGATNVRAKQIAIGTGSADLSAKSINELSDVNSTATDDGLLSYDASTEKWTTTTTLDGGTF
jgi:hypothetical protein|tara:strand:+ start:901 stop:1137 length:237 start_codon:yes stop_codon:yes gene_type:complete